MGLFDSEKVNRVTDSVKKSTQQETLKKNKISTADVKTEKKSVGRPPVPKSEKGKSYTVVMKKPLIEQLELYKEEHSPDKSRSAVIVELLEEILEQKSN